MIRYGRFISQIPIRCKAISAGYRYCSSLAENFDEEIEFTAHLTCPGSQIHPYWIAKLEQLEKPAARNLVQQLISDNPLGYDQNSSKRIVSTSNKPTVVKSGSLLHFITEQKRLHPTKILLVRVGDFYETYGLDAVLLVEHVGLAPMGGKAKAGCPTGNIQQTLDRLVTSSSGSNRPGFVVAVYEEGVPPATSGDPCALQDEVASTSVHDSPAGRGRKKSSSTQQQKLTLKPRYLAQVVSPGQPTYLSDLCLKAVDIEYAPNQPFIGISRSASGGGYSLSVAHVDDRRVQVSSRLTFEGLKVQLMRLASASSAASSASASVLMRGGASSGRGGIVGCVAEPVYVQNVGAIELQEILGGAGFGGGGQGLVVPGQELPTVERLTGYPDHLFPEQVLRRVIRLLVRPHTDLNRFRFNAVGGGTGAPRPVYVSTALQVGLLPNPNIPELVPQLLGTRPGAARGGGSSNLALCSEFLRSLLMSPPPLELAACMRVLCHAILAVSHPPKPFQPDAPSLDKSRVSVSTGSLPAFYSGTCGGGGRLLSMGKVTALVEAEQCNVVLFQQILDNVGAVLAMLRQAPPQETEENSPHCAFALRLSDMEREMAPQTCMARMNRALFQIVSETLGTSACNVGSLNQLHAGCERIKDRIEGVVAPLRGRGSSATEGGEAVSSDPHDNIPAAFFHSNEHAFRFRVTPQNEDYRRQMRIVSEAAEALSLAVQNELVLRYGAGDGVAGGGADIGFDMMNNRIFFERQRRQRASKDDSASSPIATETAGGAALSAVMPIHDKRGVVIANRYTTAGVSAALARYLGAAEEATALVVRLLKALSASLCADLQTIREVAQWNITLAAVLAHVRTATQRQWRLPDLIVPLQPLGLSTGSNTRNTSNGTHSGASAEAAVELLLPGLIPYWMDSRVSAVTNDVAMSGVFLLTAPNMSGKSTLMRAVLAACLLGNCGLMVPCVVPGNGMTAAPIQIPVYSNYFLRTTSYDAPVSNQSAFALEMDDMEVLLRECCGSFSGTGGSDGGEDEGGDVAWGQLHQQRSLVMIDELGKGTSSRDGASLAGAIVEELGAPRHNIMGIFATHLHELFLLPLRFARGQSEEYQESFSDGAGAREERALPPNMKFKTMRVRAPADGGGGHLSPEGMWTYRLADGVCTDSMALHTARYCRLPTRLLKRAEELARVYDDEIFNFRDKLHLKQAGLEGAAPLSPTNGDWSGMLDHGSKVPAFASLEELLVPIHRVAEREAAAFFLIEADQAAPAALEGQCCVYILQLQKHASDLLTFYVGETASVHQRLSHWRQAYKDYEPVRVLVIQLAGGGNRSQSQQLETKLLRELKLKYNVDICNVSADENRKIF